MKLLLKKILFKLNVLYRFIRIELSINFNIPFSFIASKPLANKKKYKFLHNECKNLNYPLITKFEKQNQFSIKKKWFENLALNLQISVKKSKNNYQHGRILYTVLRKYLKTNNNITILETGTARGFSAICMARAIHDSKKKGKINTIDIIPHNTKIYWNVINDHSGKITRKNLLRPWKKYLRYINFLHGRTNKILNKINFSRVNFAFLDGAHNLKSIKIEFQYVSSRQIKGDIIIFDDVTKNKFDEIYNFVKLLDKVKDYKILYIKSSIDRSYAIATKL